MSCRFLIRVLGVASVFLLPAAASAQAGVAQTGWLSSADHEEPSPVITSLKGVGTASATAEARMMPKDLNAYCSEHAQYYTNAAACLTQKNTQYANTIFRASADCMAGTITTSEEQTYTLDGLWSANDIGAGRSRWRDSEGKVVPTNLTDNGLYISSQWETLCPGRVTPALIAKAKSAPAAAPQTARGAAPAPTPASAGARPPSLCVNQPGCDDVGAFAARVTDFRTSQYDQNTKIVSATVRFVNKTTRPLILGYVRTNAVAINEAGNRYVINSPDSVRGIGEIAGTQFDPKFTVAPGQASDTRFELVWRWNGKEIIGQRSWDMDLTVREVSEVAPGQYRFGQEHALQLKGLIPGSGAAASPSGAISSAAPRPAAPPAPAAPQVDACAGLQRCYDAGPFVAEIVQVTPSITKATYNWHVMTMSIRFRNKTNAPLALGYIARSGALVDNFSNRYVPSNPDDSRGIGKVDATKADPQFTLQPGEARAATFMQARELRETNKPMGQTFTFNLSIAQLEVLYNGQQIRTTREHSLTFADWSIAAAAAPPVSSGTTAPVPGAPAGPAPALDDLCGGRPRCYDAGNFVAEIVQTTPSIVKLTYPWHVVEMNIRFRNKTNQPIVLAYASRSGHLSDNFSNSYVPSNPTDVKGMGIIVPGKADPQFVLRPGESRAATFSQSRAITEQNKPMGVDYTYVMTISELAVLYNGQQIQTIRENSMTFTGITMGGAPVGAPAGTAAKPTATTDENIKKATDAIRDILGAKKK